MKVVCDIEADGLEPSLVHIVVCIDVDTKEEYVFHPARDGPKDLQDFSREVTTWIGHYFLQYDRPALVRLCGLVIPPEAVLDTLVISNLLDNRIEGGHSLEAWGHRLGFSKVGLDITDWSTLTPEMTERCIVDTRLNLRLYEHFLKYISSPRWADAIRTEHFLAAQCRILHDNGFGFDLEAAVSLKTEIDAELLKLDTVLKETFRPRSRLIREVTPTLTKAGTISRVGLRFAGEDLTCFSADAPFSLIEFDEFNPASTKQRIERLNEAGWRPTEKTKGHKIAERELSKLRRKRRRSKEDNDEIIRLSSRLENYRTYGWTVSETNLETLPKTAPQAAKTLVRRLLLGSRSSTLQTWISACKTDATGPAVHGTFNAIGAWTQRMSHDKPNMGNIPAWNEKQPEKTPYSDKMRSLWIARQDRLLVGVDAESIQLRIFGHYIADDEFIKSLISGKKEEKTDPHSVNQRALGDPCKSRDAAKTFIYAWLLGAGVEQVATVLDCSRSEASEAVENFIRRYPGLEYLKKEVIPKDAARGWFTGLDGRCVKIIGEDESSKAHFCLAGYLQNGEKVIMARALEIWEPRLRKEGVPFWFVDFVHDEFQIETVEDYETALYIAKVVADSLRQVGEDLGMLCPMAGSYLSDHGNIYNGQRVAIGKNWFQTH